MSGAGSGMSDLDALFQKADNVNAAMENYILERNAELLKPGEIRLLAGGNVQAEDFSDLKEFREIYCAIQYNYNKDRGRGGSVPLHKTGQGDGMCFFGSRYRTGFRDGIYRDGPGDRIDRAGSG